MRVMLIQLVVGALEAVPKNSKKIGGIENPEKNQEFTGFSLLRIGYDTLVGKTRYNGNQKHQKIIQYYFTMKLSYTNEKVRLLHSIKSPH